jgi:hypothetical protein
MEEQGASCGGLSFETCPGVSADNRSASLSVHPGRHDDRHVLARLICADSDCSEESEFHAASLAELERLMCDCGCAWS